MRVQRSDRQSVATLIPGTNRPVRGHLTDRPVTAVLSAARVATMALAGRLSIAGRAAPYCGALINAREGENIARWKHQSEQPAADLRLRSRRCLCSQ